jgi:hypothetical protein
VVKFARQIVARRFINTPQDVNKGCERVIRRCQVFQYFQIALDELKRPRLACHIFSSFIQRMALSHTVPHEFCEKSDTHDFRFRLHLVKLKWTDGILIQVALQHIRLNL